MELCSGMLCGC